MSIHFANTLERPRRRFVFHSGIDPFVEGTRALLVRERTNRLGPLQWTPLVVLLLCCALLPAQDLRYYREQAWSTEGGLPQDTVRQTLQTADGFLWIATEGGLARYDGATFTIFNHLKEPAFRSDDICCLAQDKAGDLWIGTSNGLLRFHGNRIEAIHDPGDLSSSAILGLATNVQGSLAVLTARGLSQEVAGHFNRIPDIPSDIAALHTASDGSLLLVSEGRILSLGADGATPVPLSSAASAQVKGIGGDRKRGFWTYTNTAVHFQNGSLSQNYSIGRDLPGSRIGSLFVDRGGLAWVGTNDGVTVLNSQSRAALHTGWLRGETVLQTYEDREGSYWLGTENSGLHLLRKLKFRSLLNNVAVRSLVQTSDGAVWVGTRDDGILLVGSGENVSRPTPSTHLTSPVILSLAPGAEGSVWVGTPDGLNHVALDGRVQRITSAEGLPDDYIQSLAGSADGSVWVGTRHGLVHLQGGKNSLFTRANGLPGDLIGTLLLSRGGELWMGTSGGLSRRLPGGEILNYGTRDGVGQGVIAALAEDKDGTIWMVTTSGNLSRFVHGSLQVVGKGIFAGQVQGMVADDIGYLWTRDLRGVERVAIAALNRCASVHQPCDAFASTYGQSDGIPSDEMVAGGSPVIWRMANGEIWSVTRRGLAITDPSQSPFNTLPPPVAIESFRVDDVDQQPGGGELRIPFGHTRFTFDYAAMSFVVPSAVHYRVELEGLDASWLDVGGRRSATYTNLPPRTYRFRVQAANNDGVWNNTGATLSFRVVPPVYRRWWFIALCVLLFGLLVAALYTLRLRVLRRQFNFVLNERNRLAREIHDTLAQDFVGISLQLDIVSQLLSSSKVEAAISQVQGTRQLVNEGLAEARQSIWELRANTSQDSLPSRLRKLTKRYAREDVPVSTKIGGAFRPLDPRIENEVLRIAQEALSNVQRHSGATAASAELHYGSDMLVLTVTDDGRGFIPEQAAEAEGHFGLRGMNERAGLLEAAFDIQSSPGKGTTIRLTMKIDGGKSKTAWKLQSK